MLVVAMTTGAFVVLTASSVGSGVDAGVAGTAVVDTAGVTGCVAGDDVHPAKSAVSMSSPHTIPMMMIWLVFKGLFMVYRSIA